MCVCGRRSEMVAIEPLPSTDIESKPSNSTTTGVDSNSSNRLNADGGVVSSSGDKATAAGYASDGYETASETEVGDDDTVSDNSDKSYAVEHEHQQQKSEEMSTVSKDPTYEDALNDDEFKQVSCFLLFKSRFVFILGFMLSFELNL